jgi:hypothetical protein
LRGKTKSLIHFLFLLIDTSIDLMVTKDHVRELENKFTGKEKFKRKRN